MRSAGTADWYKVFFNIRFTRFTPSINTEDTMHESNNSATESTIASNEIVSIIINHIRKQPVRLFFFGVAAVAVGVVIAFLMSERFRSYATILPPSGTSSNAGISQIAALAGINLGSLRGEGGIDMQLLSKIGESDAVLKPVVMQEYVITTEGNSRMNLIDFWKIKGDSISEKSELALIRLRDELVFDLDKKTQLLKISIATSDRNLSAEIIQSLVENLDRFLQSNRRTNAGEQKRFIESRLSDVTVELRHAEEKLKSFREKNRVATSPELQLEMQRLFRTIEIANTLYIELSKQYEITRIDEVKDIPIINVMDKPVPQIQREFPRRKMVILITVIVLCIGYIAVLLFHRLYWRSVVSILRSL
jgi:uncharacterized protein involved in exopolysaccharide biosynthesis